jgi:hypothetical protein
MVEFIISLPVWVGCGVSMVFTSVFGLVVYILSYKLITKYKSEDMKDSTGNLFRVVGMLVSLMLSLAFGDVIVELIQTRNAVEREIVAIADTFNGLELFDNEGTREIRILLLETVFIIFNGRRINFYFPLRSVSEGRSPNRFL